MKMKKLLGVFMALSLLGGVSSAQAVTAVWLEPVSQEVGNGDTVQLTLHMSFTDGPTLGGGFDLTYDSSILNFLSFEFNPLFDCAFGCPSDSTISYTGDSSTAGIVSAIGVSNFAGIFGTYLMGTFTFEAAGVGLAALSLADNFLPYGPWIDFFTGENMAVDYAGAEILVTPLPAAAWLMMAGLGFLVSFGRRKMGISA